MPLDATSSVTVSVQVLAAAYPAVTHTATVSGPGSAPATGSDTAPVVPSVALRLGKVLTSYLDGVASYRLTVTNDGENATVAPVIVTDPLPAGLSYSAADGSGWSCAPAGTEVRCAHPDAVPAGTDSAITLETLVSAIPGTVIRNVATVTGGGGPGTATPSDAAVLTVSVTGGQPSSPPPGPPPGGGSGSSSAPAPSPSSGSSSAPAPSPSSGSSSAPAPSPSSGSSSAPAPSPSSGSSSAPAPSPSSGSSSAPAPGPGSGPSSAPTPAPSSASSSGSRPGSGARPGAGSRSDSDSASGSSAQRLPQTGRELGRPVAMALLLLLAGLALRRLGRRRSG